MKRSAAEWTVSKSSAETDSAKEIGTETATHSAMSADVGERPPP